MLFWWKGGRQGQAREPPFTTCSACLMPQRWESLGSLGKTGTTIPRETAAAKQPGRSQSALGFAGVVAAFLGKGSSSSLSSQPEREAFHHSQRGKLSILPRRSSPECFTAWFGLPSSLPTPGRGCGGDDAPPYSPDSTRDSQWMHGSASFDSISDSFHASHGFPRHPSHCTLLA